MKSMSVRSMKFNLGRKKSESKDAAAAVPEQAPPLPPTHQRHHSTSDEDDLSSVGEESFSSTGAPTTSNNNHATKKKTAVDATTSYKFGIADRLTRTVEIKVAQSTVKRSPDLVPLTRQFDTFRKKIHKLIELTKKYHASLITVDDNRLRMMADLSKLAEGSPLHQEVRSLDNGSFYAVYMDVSEQVNIYATNFESQALEYLIEWESVATTRVDRGKAEVEQLRKTFLHYTQKVDKLRNQINKEEAKGKVIKEDKLEKLKRNEDKLEEASEEFEAAAAPLCYLIEEIVVHAYKDLYPLVRVLMKWDTDRSTVEQQIFGEFKTAQLEEAFQRALTADAAAPQPVLDNDQHNNDETVRSNTNNYDKSDNDLEDLEEPEVTVEPLAELTPKEQSVEPITSGAETSPTRSSKDKAPSLLKRQSSIESGDDDDDEVIFEPIAQTKKQESHKSRRGTRDHDKDRSGDHKHKHREHKHRETKKEAPKSERDTKKKSSGNRVTSKNEVKTHDVEIASEDIDFGNFNVNEDRNTDDRLDFRAKEETPNPNIVGTTYDDSDNDGSDEDDHENDHAKDKVDGDNDGSVYDYVDDSDEQDDDDDDDEDEDSDDEPPPRRSRGHGI